MNESGEIQSDNSIKVNSILRYIEPATIITLIFSATFLIGWYNVTQYFGRFNISSNLLGFSSIFYLKQAFIFVIIGLIILLASIKFKTIPFLENIIFVIACVASYFLIGNQIIIIKYLLIFSLFIVYIVTSLKGTSIRTIWLQGDFILRIIILIGVLFAVCILAGLWGTIEATNTIEGKNAVNINFTWKENPPTEINGKELILILNTNGNFYVVSKEKPAPMYPKVYIIPGDNINLAVLKKSNTTFSMTKNTII